MTVLDETALLEAIQGFEPSGLAAINVSEFVFKSEFRALCEANRCGHYNKKWTCPPHVGDVDTLINEVKIFQRAIVFQVIGQLKHSLDWKGTLAAGKTFNNITYQIVEQIVPKLDKTLVLGSGPCQICDVCAFKSSEACRHPDKAVRSLEANCVDVNALAASCGLKYINGPNTVTFFGTLLFNPQP
ncbi:MAG: DUF2284 domain-containing protein [Deltaproteobacteria bacterium]|jgi:predicted metal-binding protein|nr:DUF2284 domain-containing protein [Deltaproteobacteria bacterium]